MRRVIFNATVLMKTPFRNGLFLVFMISPHRFVVENYGVRKILIVDFYITGTQIYIFNF